MLSRLIPDKFILILLGTIALASILPVRGHSADIAAIVSSLAIFLLFFLHGLRLPRADVMVAMRNWRLQATIFGFVYAAMPLAGIAAASLGGGLIPVGLVTGILFLGLLPSTVQSAISYASIAGGNVAASVMASAISNLSGIFVTPLLAAIVVGASGGSGFNTDVALKIVTILLLPFALGQLSQPWLHGWAHRQKHLLSFMDRSAIAIAVYVAFSSAVAGGLWQVVNAKILVTLFALIAAMLVFALIATWGLGKTLKLDRADRISLIFAGSHKSIATGAPLAAILFAGPQAGMVILPALLYHLLQLIASAPLANRFAKKSVAVTTA